MGDLIDRQLVLDRINKQREHLRPYLYPWDKIGDSAYQICAEFVERIPSTEPQRKKGKWIPHNEKSREYIGTVLVNVEYDYWLCNTCGYRVEKRQPMYNFCPNCGADMRGENE